jgi:hypothetical protein
MECFMAKSPVLVAAVARELEKAPESAKLALRRLREEGMVEVKGKGRGGKEMTAQDAALLCLAMMSGDTIKDSPRAVSQYWFLLPVHFPFLGKGFRDAGVADGPRISKDFVDRLPLNRLTMMETFGTHLTSVFQSAMDGTLFPVREDFEQPVEGWSPGQGELDRWVTIRLFGPRKGASVYYGVNQQWSFRRHFGAPVDFNEVSIAYDPQRSEGRAGYLEMRQMGDKTILAIASSLR